MSSNTSIWAMVCPSCSCTARSAISGHGEILSGRYRCIGYTQRYFGRGSWRDDGPPFGVATHAEDLIAFVEALGLAPVYLVAWSYSGHVAFQAALRRPDLFRRLMVYEPGVPSYVTDPEELAAFGQDARAIYGSIAAAVNNGDLEEAARLMIDGSGGDGYLGRQSHEYRTIIRDNLHSLPRLMAQEPPPNITCEDLATLRMPVSIVHGGLTRPIFAIPSRAAARCIHHARHVEVPDVGHLWPRESSHGFAAVVEELDCTT
ncbi:alpha/beta fold hydrolase [Microvirga sp. TS319]|uniref:alpha/beta fold hydrolase n=1 Tax=Microvirga sp. TS319 TaxID=3241165 RepID=UPI00351A3085